MDFSSWLRWQTESSSPRAGENGALVAVNPAVNLSALLTSGASPSLFIAALPAPQGGHGVPAHLPPLSPPFLPRLLRDSPSFPSPPPLCHSPQPDPIKASKGFASFHSTSFSSFRLKSPLGICPEFDRMKTKPWTSHSEMSVPKVSRLLM